MLNGESAGAQRSRRNLLRLASADRKANVSRRSLMRNRHNSCGANGTYRNVCRENQCFALFVASQPPHVEDRLNCLWSLKIVIAPAGKHACDYDVRHPLQAKHCHCLPECFRERAWHEATRPTCLPAIQTTPMAHCSLYAMPFCAPAGGGEPSGPIDRHMLRRELCTHLAVHFHARLRHALSRLPR